ncbi:hypothetical protein [Streptomyces sp. P17]|uniref:hypothetical protein n=1 Tax=Streptomyces sp. P17 TaxID=3074716 RepID=UPI0028F405A5|nr:hypothetical protein [Streptomyces sp. P17]MDT9696483.1 hypothetical protein [Streptomyces sp. P17]
MTAPAPQEPEACLHFHALFLDTQLDVVWSPGLGRRIRTGLARLVPGGAPTPPAMPDVPARTPEEKGAAR